MEIFLFGLAGGFLVGWPFGVLKERHRRWLAMISVPGATNCTVEGCHCIAFERDPDWREAEEV